MSVASAYIILIGHSDGDETLNERMFTREQAIERIDPGSYQHGHGYHDSQFDGSPLIWIREFRGDGTFPDVTQELCDEAQKLSDAKEFPFLATFNAARELEAAQ